ncbi:hypothetical protein [Kineosporia sp. A_224]|uniref:hypothetical protein n=1 Tax=Kineosporia sp. A_224 TaxID=1962180 RepID=UPI000B4ADDB1|nr:hypothetical protein [Kineosporia sp. A_224]
MPVENSRELLLQCLWQDIRGWRAETIGNVPAAGRALRAGAASDDVVAAMQASAYDALFGALSLLDAHGPKEAPPGSPGWVLVPAVEDERGRVVLGDAHDLAGLHEDFLSADPTGQEGADFFA